MPVPGFNGLPGWHPLTSKSRIENGEPSDRVGCIRVLTLLDGSTVREQLLGLSDFDLFCTCSIDVNSARARRTSPSPEGAGERVTAAG